MTSAWDGPAPIFAPSARQAEIWQRWQFGQALDAEMPEVAEGNKFQQLRKTAWTCPGQLFPGVLNPDQSVCIDASRGGLLHQLFAYPGGKDFVARKNPGVAGIGTNDQAPAVIWI